VSDRQAIFTGYECSDCFLARPRFFLCSEKQPKRAASVFSLYGLDRMILRAGRRALHFQKAKRRRASNNLRFCFNQNCLQHVLTFYMAIRSAYFFQELGYNYWFRLFVCFVSVCATGVSKLPKIIRSNKQINKVFIYWIERHAENLLYHDANVVKIDG